MRFILVIASLLLLGIGFYVMFKPDLQNLIIVPVTATNIETTSEFRSLFAGSFIAYGYLILRHTFSYNTISIALMIAYIMLCIAFGRLVSFVMDGYNHFGLIVLVGELALATILLISHKSRKNRIPY
tara:strand:+ start:732 stop:1112 length:381 start_codon:yes stop_codon:yes gene_type:complete